MDKVTPEIMLARHNMLRMEPQRYVEMMSELICQYTSDASHYHARHAGWISLDQPDRALADLTEAIRLRGHPIDFRARSNVLAELGRYREALEDLNQGDQ